MHCVLLCAVMQDRVQCGVTGASGIGENEPNVEHCAQEPLLCVAGDRVLAFAEAVRAASGFGCIERCPIDVPVLMDHQGDELRCMVDPPPFAIPLPHLGDRHLAQKA